MAHPGLRGLCRQAGTQPGLSTPLCACFLSVTLHGNLELYFPRALSLCVRKQANRKQKLQVTVAFLSRTITTITTTNNQSFCATSSAREQYNGAHPSSAIKSVDSGSPEEPLPALKLKHSDSQHDALCVYRDALRHRSGFLKGDLH